MKTFGEQLYNVQKRGWQRRKRTYTEAYQRIYSMDFHDLSYDTIDYHMEQWDRFYS